MAAAIALLLAMKVLGRHDDAIIKRVIASQSKLPPTKIARDGSFMEWAEDFQDPEPNHRLVSHLFGLFPGHTIDLEKTPDLCKAVDNSLIKRGDDGPGWSTTWKAALWAYLQHSEHAYRMIKHLIILVDPEHEADYEGGLYSNMFTTHLPFQIDANFGLSSSGAQHLNINLQKNYWPSLSCNLHECQEPLFDYISSMSVNGSKTATVNYEANGWVAQQVSDLWVKTSPDRGQAVWALWPMGGAWLSTNLWEHYTYTMDKEFLKNKAYPLLEGCTSFLLDWLIEGPGGRLDTNPSTSPEHMFIAPDQKQASVLGRHDDAIIKRVIASQSKLPPTKIARDGSVMEWAEDFQDPEPNHRHVSRMVNNLESCIVGSSLTTQ